MRRYRKKESTEGSDWDTGLLYIKDYVFYLFLIFALLDPLLLKIAMKRSIPNPKGGNNVFHPSEGLVNDLKDWER